MKYAVKLHFTTYIYDEVEANSVEDAVEKAKCNLDAMSDEDYNKTIIGNISTDESEVRTIDENGFASDEVEYI